MGRREESTGNKQKPMYSEMDKETVPCPPHGILYSNVNEPFTARTEIQMAVADIIMSNGSQTQRIIYCKISFGAQSSKPGKTGWGVRTAVTLGKGANEVRRLQAAGNVLFLTWAGVTHTCSRLKIHHAVSLVFVHASMCVLSLRRINGDGTQKRHVVLILAAHMFSM